MKLNVDISVGIKTYLYETWKQSLPEKMVVPCKRCDELKRIYEDEYIIALEKPENLATQLGSFTTDSVATRYPHLKLVHRLDKLTSGVLLLAKTRLAAAAMAELFRTEQVHKTYIAILEPIIGIKIHDNGVINSPIDGKDACTTFKVIQRQGNKVWVQLKPTTGRKHQLRRHCAEVLQVPIKGDPRYTVGSTAKENRSRMFLHAKKLTFQHPFFGKLITIESENAFTIS